MLEKQIQDLIKRFEGPFYIIKRLNENCICSEKGSNESDPHCPYCLGTGKRIKIRGARGVVQESAPYTSMRQSSGHVIVKEIFVLPHYQVAEEDIIVFEDMPYDVYQIKNFRLKNNKLTYKQLFCAPMKYDNEIFMKHFKAYQRGGQ